MNFKYLRRKIIPLVQTLQYNLNNSHENLAFWFLRKFQCFRVCVGLVLVNDGTPEWTERWGVFFDHVNVMLRTRHPEGCRLHLDLYSLNPFRIHLCLTVSWDKDCICLLACLVWFLLVELNLLLWMPASSQDEITSNYSLNTPPYP